MTDTNPQQDESTPQPTFRNPDSEPIPHSSNPWNNESNEITAASTDLKNASTTLKEPQSQLSISLNASETSAQLSDVNSLFATNPDKDNSQKTKTGPSESASPFIVLDPATEMVERLEESRDHDECFDSHQFVDTVLESLELGESNDGIHTITGTPSINLIHTFCENINDEVSALATREAIPNPSQLFNPLNPFNDYSIDATTNLTIKLDSKPEQPIAQDTPSQLIVLQSNLEKSTTLEFDNEDHSSVTETPTDLFAPLTMDPATYTPPFESNSEETVVLKGASVTPSTLGVTLSTAIAIPPPEPHESSQLETEILNDHLMTNTLVTPETLQSTSFPKELEGMNKQATKDEPLSVMESMPSAPLQLDSDDEDGGFEPSEESMGKYINTTVTLLSHVLHSVSDIVEPTSLTSNITELSLETQLSESAVVDVEESNTSMCMSDLEEETGGSDLVEVVNPVGFLGLDTASQRVPPPHDSSGSTFNSEGLALKPEEDSLDQDQDSKTCVGVKEEHEDLQCKKKETMALECKKEELVQHKNEGLYSKQDQEIVSVDGGLSEMADVETASKELVNEQPESVDIDQDETSLGSNYSIDELVFGVVERGTSVLISDKGPGNPNQQTMTERGASDVELVYPLRYEPTPNESSTSSRDNTGIITREYSTAPSDTAAPTDEHIIPSLPLDIQTHDFPALPLTQPSSPSERQLDFRSEIGDTTSKTLIQKSLIVPATPDLLAGRHLVVKSSRSIELVDDNGGVDSDSAVDSSLRKEVEDGNSQDVLENEEGESEVVGIVEESVAGDGTEVVERVQDQEVEQVEQSVQDEETIVASGTNSDDERQDDEKQEGGLSGQPLVKPSEFITTLTSGPSLATPTRSCFVKPFKIPFKVPTSATTLQPQPILQPKKHSLEDEPENNSQEAPPTKRIKPNSPAPQPPLKKKTRSFKPPAQINTLTPPPLQFPKGPNSILNLLPISSSSGSTASNLNTTTHAPGIAAAVTTLPRIDAAAFNLSTRQFRTLFDTHQDLQSLAFSRVQLERKLKGLKDARETVLNAEKLSKSEEGGKIRGLYVKWAKACRDGVVELRDLVGPRVKVFEEDGNAGRCDSIGGGLVSDGRVGTGKGSAKKRKQVGGNETVGKKAKKTKEVVVKKQKEVAIEEDEDEDEDAAGWSDFVKGGMCGFELELDADDSSDDDEVDQDSEEDAEDVDQVDEMDGVKLTVAGDPRRFREGDLWNLKELGFKIGMDIGGYGKYDEENDCFED
ncbi:UNVERIFIED_CONTAM: hypothetical protein HDU68_010784 [Siphonaria sp. JEL0065]|nr:hypothetical protein HDU68_010784 [Siphonaria sp. JEL0065]